MTDLFIRCETCGEAITRNAVVAKDQEWVHVDDEVTYKLVNGRPRRVSATNYDHLASPVVIDLEKKSELGLVIEIESGYVDTRPIEAVARDDD